MTHSTGNTKIVRKYQSWLSILTGLPLVERKRRLDELRLVGLAWATNAD